jgi:cytochrome c biogenesis protein CcmG/thiol:disulfide interchange protein DsbE
MKKLLFVPLGLFLLLAIAIAVVLIRGRDPHEIPSPLINKAAPAFQLPATA